MFAESAGRRNFRRDISESGTWKKLIGIVARRYAEYAPPALSASQTRTPPTPPAPPAAPAPRAPPNDPSALTASAPAPATPPMPLAVLARQCLRRHQRLERLRSFLLCTKALNQISSKCPSHGGCTPKVKQHYQKQCFLTPTHDQPGKENS